MYLSADNFQTFSINIFTIVIFNFYYQTDNIHVENRPGN